MYVTFPMQIETRRVDKVELTQGRVNLWVFTAENLPVNQFTTCRILRPFTISTLIAGSRFTGGQ